MMTIPVRQPTPVKSVVYNLHSGLGWVSGRNYNCREDNTRVWEAAFAQERIGFEGYRAVVLQSVSIAIASLCDQETASG